MSASESIGFVLAVLGILFAFETPRRWLIKTLRIDRADRKIQSVAQTHQIEGPTVAAEDLNDFQPRAANIYSPITVAEIISSINSAPPYQREELSTKYNGIAVRWQGYLREARTSFHDKDSVTINLNVAPEKAIGNSFWLTEKLASFQDIKTLPIGAKIEVIGLCCTKRAAACS
jgi:hypothetical protein